MLHVDIDRSQLNDAVVEGGIPFRRVHGTHAFESPGLDPRFNQVFNTAMFNHTTIVMKKIHHLYKGFEKLTQLVDVGGGLGVTFSLITSTIKPIGNMGSSSTSYKSMQGPFSINVGLILNMPLHVWRIFEPNMWTTQRGDMEHI